MNPPSTSPRGVALFVVAAAAIFASACGGQGVGGPSLTGLSDTVTVIDSGTAYWPNASWRSTSASRVGIDENVLRSITGRLGKNEFSGIHSFFVARHGYVVAEQYYGVTAGASHTMQSVTKSVTSLLTGIAVDEGRLRNLDAPVLGFFPEYTDLANVDAEKRALTIRHLLTMRTNMSFYENPYPGSPLQQLNDCRGCDWLHLILDRPMTGSPGSAWAYNSGAPIVVGGILYSATGMSADEYARQKLFTPLGITNWSWYKGSPNGLPHMGGGLDLRTSDLARIGYLVLRRGKWAGAQIVSSAWIDASTRRVTTSTERYFPRDTDYGMYWWLFPRNNQPGTASNDDYIIAGSGSGGQWLFIDPKLDLIVVFTGALGSASWSGVQIFFDELLPAIR